MFVLTIPQTEIRKISRESAPDVDTWIAHAQTIQDDIESSRRLASGIVQQAEAEKERLANVVDKEHHVAFLEAELAFSEHLAHSLKVLQWMDATLDQVEQLAGESKLLEALQMLEGTITVYTCYSKLALRYHILINPDVRRRILNAAPDETTRAMRIIDDRCSELRKYIHEQLHEAWAALIDFDLDARSLTIHRKLPGKSLVIT
jgi:centromere/kinetochore protein ZW10